MTERTLTVAEITPENVRDYGTLIETEGRAPLASSPEFSYWNDLCVVDMEGRTGFGVLETHPRPLVVSHLERHSRTTETLVPLTGDVILVLGKPTKSAHAELSTVAAFHLPLGKALTLGVGTWHDVPLARKHPVKVMVVFRSGTPSDDLVHDQLAEGSGVTFKIMD